MDVNVCLFFVCCACQDVRQEGHLSRTQQHQSLPQAVQNACTAVGGPTRCPH